MSIFKKVEQGLEGLFGDGKHSHTHLGHTCNHPGPQSANRFNSFASESRGDAKWYIDGCSYFWAVSEALESAQESIYILDWWLSPELYLRRPPSQNERYRLDNLLKAAANRGVKVYIIVYKEVEQALTLNSAHTRHHLEGMHQNNIYVFRHPDHAPAGYDLRADFQNMTLNNFNLAKASGEALKTLYGMSDDTVLFWAHHEKLLVVDQRLVFMGGLDLCFGRWDTQSHPISDAHPGNLDAIIFPGQDYNNARIFDFANVDKWQENKLDRTQSSRMGWSDISLSLQGPIVRSLIDHFVDRWNYIFEGKYKSKDPGKYHRLDTGRHAIAEAPPSEEQQEEGGFRDMTSRLLGDIGGHINKHLKKFAGEDERDEHGSRSLDRPGHHAGAETKLQLARSCTWWSSGHDTEHSIANAYIHAITNARYFIYIENQFFITATSNDQHPVVNKIGAAIVDRILRAHNNGEDFRIMVMIPAVPAFAGDLKSDGALGTRAIMEFQYNSICRGGNSIIERLRSAGVEDVNRYIGFYNLRNFDRINVSSTMGEVEQEAGVSYETARKEHDDVVGAGNYPEGEGTYAHRGYMSQYDRYQEAAARISDPTWDTISACYMDSGITLDSIPWQGDPEAELNAYVSEELYVHSKLLIADDRLVICGSANLNDRSMLGTHDSEIAIIIEDQAEVDSRMCGNSYRASRFATSLRRYLFRKHLGLIPDQRWDQPNANWQPVGAGLNEYDWGSPADILVEDPMGAEFRELWSTTARTNTEVFTKVFHNVPNDAVRSWEDYDNFFSRHFVEPSSEDERRRDGRVEYGHVVREEFPGGVAEVKEWLGRVRGTLVDMPLGFLADVEDIAKEGLTLNPLTDELYT